MGSSSDEELYLSDSEIYEYKEKPYALLKAGTYKVKGPNGCFRCPFCVGKKKKDYQYSHLLQHARGAANGSVSRSAKQKSNHLALATFLEKDLANEAEPLPQPSALPEKSELHCCPRVGLAIADVGLEAIKERKKIIGNLVDEIDLLNDDYDELLIKHNVNTFSLNRLMEENDELARTLNEERTKQQRLAREKIMRILDENEKMQQDVENEKKRLDSLTKELNKREASTERDRQILEEEKQKNYMRNNALQLASEQQSKVDEKIRRLVEKHTREKEEFLKGALELERNLSDVQKLEMEIKHLKEKLEVSKHVESNDDAAVQQKIKQLEELLQEKKENSDYLNDLNMQLMTKERQSNDELQQARKLLIEALIDTMNTSRVSIGIKRMGEIDVKAFKNACKQRYSSEEAEIKALELCSSWQEKLKNPGWHPFRIVEDKYVLKEDDKLLVQLREEWGDEAYDAVATGLKEIQEYNPSGCYAVPELWNFKENRKVKVKEVISYIFNQLKTLKRKRN